ncbi:hypothetical protein [Acidihalobacter prosperus]
MANNSLTFGNTPLTNMPEPRFNDPQRFLDLRNALTASHLRPGDNTHDHDDGVYGNHANDLNGHHNYVHHRSIYPLPGEQNPGDKNTRSAKN